MIMEVSYKKDGNRSFMIIESESLNEDDYKYQMIKNNSIKFLLPMKVNMIDNKTYLYYETTSMLSLQSMYNKKLIDHKDFMELIKSIKKVTESLKEYLLGSENILFDMECIFVDRMKEKIQFCYYPIDETEKPYGLRNLFDQMLEYVNHSDKIAVEIAYGIEEITMTDNYSIQELFEFVIQKIKEKEEKPKPEIHVKEENIFEIPKTETSFFEKIVNFFRKKEYQSKEESQKNIVTEGFVFDEMDMMQDDPEDATVFLSPAGNKYSITLKSTNLDNQICITSNIYPCIFGKSRKTSDYVIDSPVVSRVHMRLSADGDGYYIEDLNSTNGTYKNGIKLSAHTPEKIEIGDQITIADINFEVA